MDKWKNNNLSSIQEYPFDFERYIAEQLREIADPEEQVFAKKSIASGYGKRYSGDGRKIPGSGKPHL